MFITNNVFIISFDVVTSYGNLFQPLLLCDCALIPVSFLPVFTELVAFTAVSVNGPLINAFLNCLTAAVLCELIVVRRERVNLRL